MLEPHWRVLRISAGVCLALNTACGPIYFAHPPPVAGPQLVTPLGVGQVGVGVTGVKATPEAQYSSLALTNTLGGYAGVGLTPDLDLRLAGGSQSEGPLGGVSLAWTFREGEVALLRATGGLGATYSQSGYTEQHEVFDDGALVVYDDGQSVTVQEPKTYSYATLAPHVGVAAVLFPDNMVMVPTQLRVSRSSIVPVAGGDPEGTPPWWWLEASVGAAMVLDRSEVTVGLVSGVARLAPEVYMPQLGVSVSVGGRSPTPKDWSRRAFEGPIPYEPVDPTLATWSPPGEVPESLPTALQQLLPVWLPWNVEPPVIEEGEMPE
ncbi:MAG: hypothetical protein RIT28_3341 [Pseudomonadota bacterium]